MLRTSQDEALINLGRALKTSGYRFVTVTPASHARVVKRRRAQQRSEATGLARDMRDVFGWNLPFTPEALSPELWDLMRAADAVEASSEGYTSRVRFSSIDDDLFVHSRFPTQERQAVFFGPDTYRFCRMLQAQAPTAEHAVDMGCGSGAGGLVVRNRVGKLTLSDVNLQALRFASVNSALAGCHHVSLAESDCMRGFQLSCDLIVANPPYVVDPQARTYRDGGGLHGVTLAQRMMEEALAKLSPGGTFMLYTGTPIVAGRDMFWEAAHPLLNSALHDIDYREIDPDVFGEELDEPAYADAERLCVVQLVVRRKASRRL